MKKLKLWLPIAIIIVAAFYFRNWQCEEMFPTANRLACIMWK
jgi:hypothetical protein